jgi:hypothetical protein
MTALQSCTSARTSTDQVRSQALNQPAQQLLRGGNEPHGVRHSGVQIERRFIHPLGIDAERCGLPHGLIRVDADTPFFLTRQLDHTQQLLAKFRCLARQWVKPNEKLKRHPAPPARRYSRITTTDKRPQSLDCRRLNASACNSIQAQISTLLCGFTFRLAQPHIEPNHGPVNINSIV